MTGKYNDKEGNYYNNNEQMLAKDLQNTAMRHLEKSIYLIHN